MTKSYVNKVFFVGSDAEVAHHAAPLADFLSVEVVSSDDVIRLATPSDFVVVFNEYFERFRAAVMTLVERGVPTLYMIDGILEWRNSWDFPSDAGACLQTMRPVLSHKVACIGRSQARVLESWGNLGKCEVVGVPRFDSLMGRKPRARSTGDPFRLLIMTAKNPGFTPEQRSRVQRSLSDLNTYLQSHALSHGVRIEPVWRLTEGIAESLRLPNALRDTTGQDLSRTLAEVDAVVTTPSTAMLEGMLCGLPVALLDYHNCPHYVPAAWTISSQDHLGSVIPELLNPTPAKMLYQDTILHDALECRTSATSRMVRLIEEMAGIGRACRERNEPLRLPRRLLADDADGHHLPEENFDMSRLYPDHPVFSDMDRAALQAEVGHLRIELKAAQQRTVVGQALARVRQMAGSLSRFKAHDIIR